MLLFLCPSPRIFLSSCSPRDETFNDFIEARSLLFLHINRKTNPTIITKHTTNVIPNCRKTENNQKASFESGSSSCCFFMVDSDVIGDFAELGVFTMEPITVECLLVTSSVTVTKNILNKIHSVGGTMHDHCF